MKLSEADIKKLLFEYYPFLIEKERELFLSISTYGIAKNKEVILHSNRTDKNVILLLKGFARSYSINKNGEELNDHLRAEGYISGDARVFGDKTQILNVEAIGETHYLKFDISELENLSYNHPKLLKLYTTILKELVLVLSHRVHTFVTMNATERYEDLIEWNPKYLKSTFDKHIASFLGVSSLTFHRIKKKSIK